MEIILPVCYAFLFLFIIRKNHFFRIDGLKEWLLPSMFILKVVSGIILGLIYTYFYKSNTSDSFKFFSDSRIMFSSIQHSPRDFLKMFTGIDAKSPELWKYYLQMDTWLNTDVLYNDNKTMVRLNTFFRFFSLGIYNVHVVFINLFSFTGIVALLKTFCRYIPGKKNEITVLTFLLPSVIFWGSGLLKDSLLLTAFGLIIYFFDNLMRNGFSRKYLIIFLISLSALCFIKIYVIFILMPGLTAWIISKNMRLSKAVLTFILCYSLFFVAAFNLYRISSTFNIQSILYYKQRNFILYGAWNNASMILIPYVEMSAASIVKNSPVAFAITLLRPFMTDVNNNPLILLSAIENIFIGLMIIVAIIFPERKLLILNRLFLLSAVFVFLIFVLIGITTPVLGAIVRYRIVALPMLMYILVSLTDTQKLKFRIVKLTGSKAISKWKEYLFTFVRLRNMN